MLRSSGFSRVVLPCLLVLLGSCADDPAAPTDDDKNPAQGSDDEDGSDDGSDDESDDSAADADDSEDDGDDGSDDGSDMDAGPGGDGDGDGPDGEPGSIILNTSSSGADVRGDVEGFPLAITLTGDNFDFSAAAADGSDLRFRDADGNLLAHEIESWDAAGQRAAVWVRVDVKGDDADQLIRMTTGEDGEGGSDGKRVFSADDGWVSVWHLSDDGDEYRDTTENAEHGTGRNISGGSNADGRIGRAVDLENDDKQYIRIEGSERNELYQLDDNATYSIWVKPESHEVDYQCMFSKGENGFRIHYYGSSGWTENDDRHITEPCLDPGDRCPLKGGNDQSWMGTDVKPGEWFHLALVVRNQAIEYYINGVLEVEEGQGNVSSGFEIVAIGNNADRARSFDGIVDEARIANTPRSADWMKLEYENQRPDAKLVTILR